MFQDVCHYLPSVHIHLLPQQHLEAVVLVQQVEDVRHLVIPADARQQTHLHAQQHIHQVKNDHTPSGLRVSGRGLPGG